MTEQPQATLTRDEGQLVSEAKAGNYAAFEELVNRYEKKIYRLGMNITGNREDAEDVLQDAFLKAFQHLPDFREDSRFYTWITRIAVNEALMKLRKRKSSKEVGMEDSEDDNGDVQVREFADWKPNPEQQFAQTELEQILQTAVGTLSPGFRTVFYLRDVEGLSTEETAELLDLSVGAVKARLFRARLRLREELSKIFKRG
jgi:RNA polymerase sigma-70 factor (ECF subfamily)